MTARVAFFLLCEGTSDEPLVEHIETLVARFGAGEALGIARSGGGSTEEKLGALLEQDVLFDFVAVHRDADSRNPDDRVSEVEIVLNRLGVMGCPVVPVQMTEAWLLVDEQAIRAAVGRPLGREQLGVPPLREIERTHDPKMILRQALISATGTTGRRHRQAARQWSAYRRVLMQRLDVDGPVTRLHSWQRMVEDVERVVEQVLSQKERVGD